MILPLLASCTQSEVVKISGSVQFVGGGNKNKVTVSQSDGFGQIILAETTINPDNTYSLEVVPANPGVVNITCCEEQRVRAWLEDEDYIVKSPVRRIHRIKTAKIIKEAFTDESFVKEFTQFKADCASLGVVRAADIIVEDLVLTR